MSRTPKSQQPRVAFYIRYSSHRQREESADDQLRKCREAARSMGLEEVAVYCDRALSGADAARPEFQRMKADASIGLIDVAMGESLDRFSRDQEHIAGF